MAVVNVNTVKAILEDLARKSQTTGYLTPSRFNRALPFVQREEYLAQRPKFESGEISIDDFSIAKKIATITLDSSGVYLKPSDYLWYNSGGVYSYGKDVNGNALQVIKALRFMSDEEWTVKRSNRFEAPTKKRPIAVEYPTYFIIYPTDLFRVQLSYIAVPPDPVWAYTVVSQRPVYDPNNSVQFTLPVQLTNNIVWRLARYLGIETMQTDLTASSSQLINSAYKE